MEWQKAKRTSGKQNIRSPKKYRSKNSGILSMFLSDFFDDF